MKYILFFLLGLFAIFPIYVKSESESIAKTYSYFETKSTNNGIRRFLAIGNFFDTTNSAYFEDSVSKIGFDMPPIQGDLKSVTIYFYKYANAANQNVEITAILNSEIVSTKIFNQMDMDYQEWQIEIPLEKLNQNKLDIQLVSKSDSFRYGVAICSGNFSDSVCPDNYHPKLIINYEPNIKGNLEYFNFPTQTIYNSTFQDNKVSCSPNSGCDFNLDVFYNDPDNNAKLYIYNKSNNIKVIELSINIAVSSTVFFVDGDYSLVLYADDLLSRHELWSSSFIVRTTLPSIPKILTKDKYASRQGISMLMETAPLSEYQFKICTDYTCNKKIETFRVRSQLVFLEFNKNKFEDNKTYLYLINQLDEYGNISPSRLIEIIQNNKLIEVDQNKLTSRKLSGISTKQEYNQIQARLINTDFRFKISGDVIKAEDGKTLLKNIEIKDGYLNLTKESINILANGNYYVILNGQDLEGYPLKFIGETSFSVDKIPPLLYK